MTRKQELFCSILKDLCALIRSDEGEFAELVLGDLYDALAISENRYKTAYQWLRDYRQMIY
jgi:hypothetical protein